MRTFPFVRTLALLFSLSTPILLQAHSPAEEMAEATSRFLAALSPDQKSKCTFAFGDDERQNWHFVPRERKGLPLKEMTPAQRHLASGLLATGLSQRGYVKATSIMSLEEILKELEQGNGPTRDPDRYYLSFFGVPDPKKLWGWRLEGHHLAFNFTLAGDQISSAPSFLGSNPAEVKSGPRKGLRVLASEEDLGRQLVLSLTEDQRKEAIYTNTAPSDIITGSDRKARLLTPAGLSAERMTEAQSQLLWSLIREYVYRCRTEVADHDLHKIEQSGAARIHFAWAGRVEPGQPHYYRVQGPTFLLEYDNTQNQANHVHAAWRDLEGDFGEDLLRKHYDQDHRP